MRILFTHRYYWPDTPPYAAILRVIAEHFAGAGHDVRVFAGQPSYNERQGGAARRERINDVTVRRIAVFRERKKGLAARLVNVGIYCGALFGHVLRTRADIVTAGSFPPIIAGWTASLAAKLVGSKFVYHVQDVHPEVSYYSGTRLGRGLPLRLLRWLDNQTLKRASAIVTLSDDMARTLQARMPSRKLPIEIINNFKLESFGGLRAPPSDLVKPVGVKRIIFAGNLGRFQNLPLLTQGIAHALDRHPNAQLFFLGNGEVKEKLKRQWERHPQIRFAAAIPYAQAEMLIADADIGLVSLSRGIYHASYPSKVLTYQGLGIPMLALVEPESSLAATIEKEGIGTVSRGNTIDDVTEATERAIALVDGEPQKARRLDDGCLKTAKKQWTYIFNELIN